MSLMSRNFLLTLEKMEIKTNCFSDQVAPYSKHCMYQKQWWVKRFLYRLLVAPWHCLLLVCCCLCAMCTPLHMYDRYCVDVPTACRFHLYRCQHADIVIHVWNLSLLCSNSQSFQSTLDIFIDCVIIIGFWCQYFGSVLLCRSVDVQVQCTTNALWVSI